MFCAGLLRDIFFVPIWCVVLLLLDFNERIIMIGKTKVRPLDKTGERRCIGYTCEIIEETKFVEGYIDAYLPFMSPETNQAEIYCCVVVTKGEFSGKILIVDHGSLEVVLE